MKTYGALNPEQLARLFEMRQEIALTKCNSVFKTKIDKARAEAEAVAFREAAHIVRNTEFVGWTHESRIVEEIAPRSGDQR